MKIPLTKKKKKGFSLFFSLFDLVQQNCASENRKSINSHGCLQASIEDALSPHLSTGIYFKTRFI